METARLLANWGDHRRGISAPLFVGECRHLARNPKRPISRHSVLKPTATTERFPNFDQGRIRPHHDQYHDPILVPDQYASLSLRALRGSNSAFVRIARFPRIVIARDRQFSARSENLVKSESPFRPDPNEAQFHWALFVSASEEL
jgi:hypothetical protein